MAPGEWKFLNNTGGQLKDNIVPLPTKEPSPTLFNLITLLLNSGKEMSMTVEAVMGQNPGQNQPLGTTIKVMEKALQMLEGIYMRIRSSLADEVGLIQKLNARYLSQEKYQAFHLNDEISTSDFSPSVRLQLTAEKTLAAKELRRMRADFLIQAMSLGGFKEHSVKKNLLEAYEIPNIDEYLLAPEEVPPPPEDPSITVAKIKQQTDSGIAMAKAQEGQAKLELEHMKSILGIQMKEMELKLAEQTNMIKEMKIRLDAAAKMAKLELEEKALKVEARSE
jgi:hypothetical protein